MHVFVCQATQLQQPSMVVLSTAHPAGPDKVEVLGRQHAIDLVTPGQSSSGP